MLLLCSSQYFKYVCCVLFEDLELQKRGNGHTGLTWYFGDHESSRNCVTAPLQGLLEWFRNLLQATLGSAASLEERWAAEEMGVCRVGAIQPWEN